MGVYNEVYKKCPHCERGHGRLQVKFVGRHQVSQFRLDDLDDLADQLTEEEMEILHTRIRDEPFRCTGCDREFLLDEARDGRAVRARELFG